MLGVKSDASRVLAIEAGLSSYLPRKHKRPFSDLLLTLFLIPTYLSVISSRTLRFQHLHSTMTAPTILTWQKVSAMLKGYPGMKTHGFLVLEIPLVFDPATESVQLTGINLQYAGERELFLEQYGHAALARNRPILSQEETAAHLNNGTFTRAFNTLQEKGAWGRMILLTAYCMKVGGNITSDQIGFLKSVYTKVDMPVGVQEQFAEALEEYTSGEPYRPLEKKWAKDRKHIHESDT